LLLVGLRLSALYEQRNQADWKESRVNKQAAILPFLLLASRLTSVYAATRLQQVPGQPKSFKKVFKKTKNKKGLQAQKPVTP